MELKPAVPAHNLSLGIGLILTAFFCAAAMSALSKEASGVQPLLLLFFQYSVGFALFLPRILSHGSQFLKTDRLQLHLFRSVAGSVCQLLFFVAVKSIPLLDSVLLTNAAPLFIPLVIYVWLHKKVQPAVWFSLAIGLAGIVLIIQPGPQMFQNPASLIALAAGLFSAIALVATNRLSATEPPLRIMFYNFGFSTLLLIPICVWKWQPPTQREWLLLLGIGALYALTQYLITLAYHYATAEELSPFNYSVVVFSGMLGWIFFHNVPGLTSVIGTLLICAGGILSIKMGHHEGLGHSTGNGGWFWHWRFRRPVAPTN